MEKTDRKIVKGTNFSHLTREHVNKWVALSLDDGSILMSGDSAGGVWQKVHGMQGEFVLHRVLDPDIIFSG